MRKISKLVLSSALVLSSMVGFTGNANAVDSDFTVDMQSSMYYYDENQRNNEIIVDRNKDIDVEYVGFKEGALENYNETINVTAEQAGTSSSTYKDLSTDDFFDEGIKGVAVCNLTLNLNTAKDRGVNPNAKNKAKYTVKAKGNSTQKGVTDAFCQKEQKAQKQTLFLNGGAIRYNNYRIFPKSNRVAYYQGKKATTSSTSPYLKGKVVWKVTIKGSRKIADLDWNLKKVSVTPQAISTAPKQKNIKVEYANKNSVFQDKITISGYKKGSIVSVYDKNGKFVRNFQPKSDKMVYTFNDITKATTDEEDYFSDGLFFVTFKEKNKGQSYAVASDVYTSSKVKVKDLKANSKVGVVPSGTTKSANDLGYKGNLDFSRYTSEDFNYKKHINVRFTFPKPSKSKSGIKYRVYYKNKEVFSYVTTGKERATQLYTTSGKYIEGVSLDLKEGDSQFKEVNDFIKEMTKKANPKVYTVEEYKDALRDLQNYTYSIQDNDLKESKKTYAFIDMYESNEDSLVVKGSAFYYSFVD